MTDKEINKQLCRGFSTLGWAVAGYCILMNLLVVLAVAADALSQSLRSLADDSFTVDLEAISGNAWGYLLLIAVGLVVLQAWKGRDYWKQEVLVKEKPMTLGVLFGVLSLCIGAQVVYSLWVTAVELVMNLFGKSVMPILESISGSSDTLSMFLYASLLGPIAEEILFRGLALRSLRPYGKRFAILCSAFLFGLYHGNLLQVPYTFLVGLVLGYVTVEYSILWAVFLHMFNNLVLADLLTRLTELLPPMAGEILNLVILLGFALISVVLLIRKRKEIRAYAQSEWMDRRCLKCFFGSPGVIAFVILMTLNMAFLFVM